MINQTLIARPVPRLALFAADIAVTAVTPVAFGLFGGFALLVAGPTLAVFMIKPLFGS